MLLQLLIKLRLKILTPTPLLVLITSAQLAAQLLAVVSTGVIEWHTVKLWIFWQLSWSVIIHHVLGYSCWWFASQKSVFASHYFDLFDTDDGAEVIPNVTDNSMLNNIFFLILASENHHSGFYLKQSRCDFQLEFKPSKVIGRTTLIIHMRSVFKTALTELWKAFRKPGELLLRTTFKNFKKFFLLATLLLNSK